MHRNDSAFLGRMQHILLAVTVLVSLLGFSTSASPDAEVIVDHGAADPAVSPDGKQIALSILGKIWLVPEAGGAAREVTQGLAWDSHPAWSPDGRFLAYAHEQAGGSDLIVYNFANGESSSLYHTERQLGAIEFAPLGGDLYFILINNQFDAHLWKIPSIGGEAKQLTETQNWHEWSFALSPDGTRALLDSGRYGGSNLYLLSLGDRATTRLSNTSAHQTSCVWSADGKTLGYVERSEGRDAVMLQPVAGVTAKAVITIPYGDTQISLDPDGVTAVVVSARKLYRLRLADGQMEPIPFQAHFLMPALAPADLVVTHARLFDGTGESYRADATIEIHDGKIARVSTGAPANLPAGTAVLDAQGKAVLAGLMDNHYHYWDPFDGSRLVAHGITEIRDPGSAMGFSANFKEAIALGLASGPDIYTCGPLIDGRGGYHPYVDVELTDPAAAAPLVRALKAEGADCLKVYFQLNPPVLAAVIAEAHRVGLRVTGHIGVRTSWGQALDDGIDGLNHIRVWADFLPLSEQPQGENESLDFVKNPIGRMQADWSEIDPASPRVGALIAKMAVAKVGFDPTLSIQLIGDPMRRMLSLEQFHRARQSYQRMSEFVYRAWKEGVPILAGTDDGSLNDEIEAYAAAGIPPAEVIRAATVNGARWLGHASQFGTIAPGEKANLILVEGDPLKNVSDLHNISVVIKGGRIVFQK